MQGKYTVNEVEERTKVPGTTLRQWERRYGFPKPERSDAGYRLYSDQDLGHIDAMKRHIAQGIPASRAAELVRGVLPAAAGPRPAERLAEELVTAFVRLDDDAADRVLGEAHSLHPIDVVMVGVMAAALRRLHELCEGGSLERAVVQSSTVYLHGRLRLLLSQSPSLSGSAVVLVACAPGNRHEIGPLMLAVLLRRAGFRVHFLGADTAVADLVTLALRQRPVAALLSAVELESLEALEGERERLQGLAPILGFGGAAFDRFPESAVDLGGFYLGAGLPEAVKRFHERAQSVERLDHRPQMVEGA